MYIKKNDIVNIMAGKDRGKTGKVLEVRPDQDRVVVEGVNTFKKHVRPRRQGEKGERIEVIRAVSASNVMLVCRSCKRSVRVGSRMEGTTKVRVCKKCGATV